MKNYIVNDFKAINYQYAVGQLSTCIDLEECRIKTMMFEKYPSISPYTYCANNPMKYVDPTGMENEEIVWHPDKHGNLIADRYDNAVTLSNYLGISDDAAHAIFYNMNNWDGGKNTEGIKDIEGHVLTIPGGKVGNRGGFTFTDDNNPGNRSKTSTKSDIKSIDITKLVHLFDSWVGTLADVLQNLTRQKQTDVPNAPSSQKEESKNYEGTKGHFKVIGKDGSGKDCYEKINYRGTPDSLKNINKIKNDPNKTLIGVSVDN